MAGELVNEYQEYLDRFEAQIGDVQVGGFAKHNGQLIQKLSYEEFEPLFEDYTEATTRYFESVERGDTINDLIVKRVRVGATKLVLKSPV